MRKCLCYPISVNNLPILDTLVDQHVAKLSVDIHHVRKQQVSTQSFESFSLNLIFTQSKCRNKIVLTSGCYCVILFHREAAMVKLVDTLVLGTNANASRFESEWRHRLFPYASSRWTPVLYLPLLCRTSGRTIGGRQICGRS